MLRSLAPGHGLAHGLAHGLIGAVLFALLAPAPAHAGPESKDRRKDRRKDRVTVAVLYFDYNGAAEDMSFLRKGLAQMLVSDLVDTPGITVLERMKLEEALAELDLNRSKRIDKSSALRVGKLLGARYLVAGSYTVFKEQMIVSVRVFDVERGKVVIGGKNRKGKFGDFMQLEQEVAAELRAIMSERLAPAKSSERTSRAKSRDKRKRRKKLRRPKRMSAKVAARYGRALDAIDRGDKKNARDQLAAIVKEQPDFEMASIDLAGLAQ